MELRDGDHALAEALAALVESVGDSATARASASPVRVDDGSADAVATKRAQRRHQHREVVARSRGRQRERVAVLVKQEANLRQQLTRLLQARAARSRTTQEADDGEDDEDDDPQAVYAALVARQQELFAANDALDAQVHRHYLFSRLAQFERSYVLDDGTAGDPPRVSKKQAREETTKSSTEASGAWLAFLAGHSPIFYTHESPAQCDYLVSMCFHLASDLESAFDEGTHLRIDEAHVLGWRARRAIHWHDELQKKSLYFTFSRRVASTQATLLEIQQRSWQVLSTPELQARLYSVPVTTQLAQQIDEHAQIVLQHKAYHVPVWLYSLTAQALEPGVVRQSMMVLDKAPPSELDASSSGAPKVVWLQEGIICLTFREVHGGGAVEVEFAGCMRCIDERHAQFMLIDVGCVLVRWENFVLPSRLLLWDIVL